jgi:hypothetical protein
MVAEGRGIRRRPSSQTQATKGESLKKLLYAAMLAMLTMLVLAPAAMGQQDLDCADFVSQAEAQATLRENPNDPHGLDGNDDDGIACESLPAPRDEVPVQGAMGAGGGGAATGDGGAVGGANGGAIVMPETGGPALLAPLAGLALVGLGIGVRVAKGRDS